MPEQRKQKIRDTVIELKEYMQIHFKHEESFMRLVEFPILNEHTTKHNIIIESMNTMLATLPTMSIKEFEKELAYFIDSSLVNHILNEDTKIQEWSQAKEGQLHVVKWSSKYSIGNEKIDNEHKLLFQTANEAFAECAQGKQDKTNIKEIVVKFSLYIKNHFEHEEQYMKEINYPGLAQHHEKHEKIKEEMNLFLTSFTEIDILTLELELAIFIEKWLIHHIIYEDRKINDFLNPDLGEIDLEIEETKI